MASISLQYELTHMYMLTMPSTVSNVLLRLKMPSVGTSPAMDFKAYRASRFAGVIRDLIVSVPVARVLKLEAAATAELEDPPGSESS